MDRREFIVKSGKVLITYSILGAGLLSLTGCSSNEETKDVSTEGISKELPESTSKELPLSDTKNSLVAYFSHSGNTREIANQIHESTGGDIFEIQTVDPYPGDYDKVVEIAKQEQKSAYRPALKIKVETMDSYNTVFVGYPNWWGTIPMAVFTFLEGYDFSGKTIVPFCTHEGSLLGRSVTDIAKLCPQSTLLEGLAVRGKDVKKAQNKVSQWLREMGMTS